MRGNFRRGGDWRRSLIPFLVFFLAVTPAVFTWPASVASPQPVSSPVPEDIIKMSPGELRSRNQACTASIKEIEALGRQSPRTVEELKAVEAKLERAVKALSACDARVPASVLENASVLAAAEELARRDGVKKVANEIRTGGLSRLPGGVELKSRIQEQLRADASKLKEALQAIEATAAAFHKSNADKLTDDAKRRRASAKDSMRPSEATTATAALKPMLLRASFAVDDLHAPADPQERTSITILSCGGKVGEKLVECRSEITLIAYLLRKFGEVFPPDGGPTPTQQCLAAAEARNDQCVNSVGPKCDRDCDALCGAGCDANPFVLDKDKCKSDDCVPNQGLFNKACESTCDATLKVGCLTKLGLEKAACLL
jgi:hypothetical protein